MTQALYRKWRPARFEQVVGQEHVTRTLQNAVSAGRIGHAYLFSGPRGTGKTTIARLLAKAANCLDEDLARRPCDLCGPCRAVNDGRFLDLIEIDAASNTGVDDIRDLRDKINFAPSEGRFKVYIIDEVHMLSTAAFNALLKTLEEPPGHAIFVLATTEEHKVLLTIKSRCQQFNFRLLTTAEIVGRLQWLIAQEQLTVEAEALAMIARQGAGSLRDAESLLDQLIAAPGDVITLERAQRVLGTASVKSIASLAEAWLAGDGAAGLHIIHEALGSGADARQFARQMVAYLRQLLLLRTAGRDLVLDATPEQKDEMERQALRSDRLRLIDAVKRFNEATTTQSSSWQPQLPLELAFIELLPQPMASSFESSSSLTIPQIEVKPRPDEDGSEAPAVVDRPAASLSAAVESSHLKNVHDEIGLTPELQVEASDVATEEKILAKQEKTKEPQEMTLSLAWVTGNWPLLREQVAQRDKSLPALLASCKPLAAEGNTLVIGFDYPILKDKFDKKDRAGKTVAEVLSQMTGIQCLVRTVVTESYTPPPKKTSIEKEAFSALAQELGGIINEN